jgi:hypothetical protein
VRFGKANLFIDVDSLLAGQRFDKELAKALAACDVLIAVIGQRWMELLKAKITSGEREEIAAAFGALTGPAVAFSPAPDYSLLS